MVSTKSTIVSRSSYVAPACKLYSINIESVIAQSPYGDPGAAGQNPGIGDDNNNYGEF